MMLRNRPYTLTPLATCDAEIRYEAHIEAAHRIFAGHFPAQPILPGVCTLTMLRDAIALHVGHPIRFDYIRECKFLSPVDPRETDSLSLHLIVTEGEVRASVADGERPVLKLKASYIPLHDV